MWYATKLLKTILEIESSDKVEKKYLVLLYFLVEKEQANSEN